MAKETSLLQADINSKITANGQQLITGPVMNGIASDMVGNDWTVDADGNRFLIDANVIVGADNDIMNQLPPGVVAQFIAANGLGVVGETVMTRTLDSLEGYVNTITLFGDTHINGSVRVGDDFTFLSGIEETAPGIYPSPFVANYTRIRSGAPDEVHAFMFIGELADADGYPLETGQAIGYSGILMRAIDGSSLQQGLAVLSKFGLRLGNVNNGAYLMLSGEDVIGYTPTGGEIRFNGLTGKHEGYDGSSWVEFGGGGSNTSWELTGNAGLDSNTNFIGTTDATPLIFKFNNIFSGYLGDQGNIFYGVNAGTPGITGICNTLIGAQTGLALSSQSYNTFVGFGAGYQSTGDNNVFIGTSAGQNVNSSNNTFIGWTAGGNSPSVTGSDNTVIGYAAGLNISTGNFSTLVGGYAGSEITSGYRNTMMGYSSGRSTNTGIDNVIIGYYAGYTNTSGGYNVIIGTNAGYSNLQSYNTFIGAYAGYLNTNGANNVALGANALYNNSGGLNLVAVGTNSLMGNTTGSGSIAIGFRALDENTTGDNNIAIGQDAIGSNQAGHRNIGIGRNTLMSIDVMSDNIAIGDHSQYSASGNGNVAIGTQTLYISETDYNTAIGYYALHSSTTGSQNTAVGGLSLQTCTTGYQNTAVGYGALQNTQDGYLNTALGYLALRDNTSGYANQAFGSNAMRNVTSGHDNLAFGSYAGNGIHTSSGNIAVGNNTLYNSDTGNNLALGHYSGNNISSGGGNIFIGNNAGLSISTGSNNTFIGFQANGPSTVNHSIALTKDATVTTSNQLMIGSTGSGISEVVIGNSLADSAPLDVSIKGTSAFGTNVQGADMSLYTGRGTGSALGGAFTVYSSNGHNNLGSGNTLRPARPILYADAVSVRLGDVDASNGSFGGPGNSTFITLLDTTQQMILNGAGGINIQGGRVSLFGGHRITYIPASADADYFINSNVDHAIGMNPATSDVTVTLPGGAYGGDIIRIGDTTGNATPAKPIVVIPGFVTHTIQNGKLFDYITTPYHWKTYMFDSTMLTWHIISESVDGKDVDGVICLGKNTTVPAATVSGTNSETLCAVIPLGTPSTGMLDFFAMARCTVFSSGGLILRLRIGSLASPSNAQAAAATLLAQTVISSTTTVYVPMQRHFAIKSGASGSIVGSATTGGFTDVSGNSTYTANSVDFSTNQYLYITIVPAAVGNTLELISYYCNKM